VHLPDLPDRRHVAYRHESVVRRQQMFGYTEEALRILVTPWRRRGWSRSWSMGTDSPVTVLSQRPRPLYDYFSQLFVQVANPPLDAICKDLVTSLSASIGAEQNLLKPAAASARQLVLPFPVIDNDELAKIIHINDDGDMPGFACRAPVGPPAESPRPAASLCLGGHRIGQNRGIHAEHGDAWLAVEDGAGEPAGQAGSGEVLEGLGAQLTRLTRAVPRSPCMGDDVASAAEPAK
jgi:hypothetical protein